MNHHHRGESGILLLKYLVAETRNGNLMETPLVHESSGRLEAPACMNIRGLTAYSSGIGMTWDVILLHVNIIIMIIIILLHAAVKGANNYSPPQNSVDQSSLPLSILLRLHNPILWKRLSHA